MSGSRRPERVSDLVRAEISNMLLTELHDPAFGFVTITGVEMSPDLRSARVYFSCLDDAAYGRTEEGFARAAGFLRREVGKRCQLRYAPELRFIADHSLERGARVEKILREVLPSPEGEPDGGKKNP
jgi:ribosome-binding factor A